MSNIEDDPVIGKTVKNAVAEWLERPEFDEVSESAASYRKFIIKKVAFIVGCAIIAIIVTGFSLSVGDVEIGFFNTYVVLWEHLCGNITNTIYDYVIFNYRMPRVIIGLIAGAGLAVAGAVMQSTMKNPLADPYTTGVSSGALFGVTLGMILGYTFSNGAYALFLNAFIFSLIPVLVIIAVSKLRKVSPTVMIMAGISIMYIFNAITTLVKLRADPNDLAELYQWQVGSLSFAGWEAVPLMFTVTAIGIAILMLLSRRINVLATGDDSAIAMGINPDQLRRLCLLIIAMITAVIVSFTGLIGFVGLVAPHIARIFVGADNRYLIPASALFGACLMVTADLIGRTIIAPSVIQVGVVTAFFGGPMFLWLLLRKNSRVW